jgi:hypothetical protein
LNHPSIIGIGTANPSLRLTQEQSFCVTGYESERIRKIFLNSDIDFRDFHFENGLNGNETSDELNQRYLRGAMHIGCRAIVNCLNSCGLSAEDAVEICSACYYIDRTLETVVGNAICADGAAAFLLSGTSDAHTLYPTIIDFESFIELRTNRRSWTSTPKWKAVHCPWRVDPTLGGANDREGAATTASETRPSPIAGSLLGRSPRWPQSDRPRAETSRNGRFSTAFSQVRSEELRKYVFAHGNVRT